MRRRSNQVLIVAFAVVLLAPTVASLTHLDPMGSLDENRKLANRPTVALFSKAGLANPTSIAQQWEQYYGDHFGLRKLLIGTYRLAQFHLLRTSPNPSVVIGRSDGHATWLYLDPASPTEGIGFDSLLGKRPYSAAELEAIKGNLRRMTDLARANGVPFIIAVCPDKQSVYPEHLPPNRLPKPGTLSRLDQFWAAVADMKGIPLVDLRGPLRNAKTQAQLYYPTDTHWNWRGAVVGYETIAKALQPLEPARDQIDLSSLAWYVGPPYVGDLAKMLGLPMNHGDALPLVILPGPEALGIRQRGKLLVLGDSFFNSMGPFFEQQFKTVKKLSGGWKAGAPWLSQALLDAEKPDVVLVESIERHWTAN